MSIYADHNPLEIPNQDWDHDVDVVSVDDSTFAMFAMLLDKPWLITSQLCRLLNTKSLWD